MNANDFNNSYEVLPRLGVAMLVDGAIGINRDLHRKPAGLRVLSMVCLGSAAVTTASIIVA